MRVPIRTAMAISAALSFFFTVTIQGGGVFDTLRVMILGYHPTEGVLASVISGGGLIGMKTPLLMIPLALPFYTGILDGTDVLKPAQALLQRVSDRIGASRPWCF